jgi:hypothetical protein
MKQCCVILLVLIALQVNAEIRWTGLSGNGFWADAGNWENGLLPGPGDDVLLDNSLFSFSYKVILPDFAVAVKSVHLNPALIQNIILEIPVTNLIASSSGSLLTRAFTTTGTGYSIVIGKGATFLNSSGSSSGYSIRISDSIQIKNGGSYIHRTRTGHAEIVQYLSTISGTERGVFRFENTDAASIISLSGRTFGSLQLSSDASPLHTTSYSASGTNPVLIRGNLELEAGVSLSINFDDTITIHDDLRLNNAVFNMANGNRSVSVLLKGNWFQQAGSIRESNLQQKTGTLILAGTSLQMINCTGTIGDSILLVIKNTAGVKLENSLRLPYLLKLEKGELITSYQQMLVLALSASIVSDSSNSSTYINGPVKKEGLSGSDFMFPVGKDGFQRWIKLKNASGDFTIEYIREPAYNQGSLLESGLDHISQVEYWSVLSSFPASAQFELSFDNDRSGGVSDLSSLRVAALMEGSWKNKGNTGTTGVAFDKGSVSSNQVIATAVGWNYFSLASSTALANVLPLIIEQQWMEQSGNNWFCNWISSGNWNDESYKLELSSDGKLFVTIQTVKASVSDRCFRELIPMSWINGFCRINTVDAQGREKTGHAMRFGGSRRSGNEINVSKPTGSNWVYLNSGKSQNVRLELFDNKGSLVERSFITLPVGNSIHQFSNGIFPSGIYTLRISGRQELLLIKQLIF